MKRLLIPSCFLFIMTGMLFAQARRAPGDSSLDLRAQTKAGDNGLKMMEGELHAASSLFAFGSQDGPLEFNSDSTALTAGIPGGILVKKDFTLLLIDGRVLAKLRGVMPRRTNAVRVYGILHDQGRSMTPMRIEYRNDGEWLTFDLPASGTLSGGVQGGDE